MADEEAATVIPWSTVWVTLVVSFVVFLVFYAFFYSLQSKHAASSDYTLFETRHYKYASRSPPPFSKGCFGWAVDAYHVSDDETLRCVGLDSYMFLRFLRLGFLVSLLGTVLGCVILIPIYATGEENGPETQEFNSITLARVSQGSPRLWAAAICWTVFCLFVLSELDTEWLLYKPKRYEFLAKGDVDTECDYRYACIIENIPRELASNHALRHYFEQLFPNKVRQVNVLIHAEHLEQLVAERQIAIEACEKAVAFTHAKPDKPAPQVKVGGGKCGGGGEKVDAISHYGSEIRRLDTEIDAERASLCAYADSAHLQETENSSSLLAAGSKFFQSLVKSKKEDTPDTDDQGDVQNDDEKGNDDKGNAVDAGDTGIKEDQNADDEGDTVGAGDPEEIGDSYEVGLLSNRTDMSDATVQEAIVHEGRTSSTGFVTFTSLRAKQAAVQCEISGKVDNVDVAPAPIPAGIVWRNALTPLTTQQYASMVATAFWLVGVLFWAVPVAFVTAIANLNSILKSFGAAPMDPDTFYYGLISGILPVAALQILMLVLYLAIQACAKFFIRCKSMPQVDAYTFFWNQCYQFANLWLILIGGSLFNQIDALLNNPEDIAQLLAAALPGSSPFFLNIMIMGSFLTWGVELSMIASYGVKLIMGIIQPEAMKTQRMLDEEKKPQSIIWGKILPPIVFTMLVAFVYMPIVPLMEPFAMLYFGGWYLVFKHQCLHVYHQEFEGGGLLWSNLFGFTVACLYTAEVIVITYLGLKESIGPTIFSIIPFVCTIIIHCRLRRNTIGPLKNLSLQEAAAVDMKGGELSISEDDEGPTAVAVERQLYGQPCLKASADEREPMPYRRNVGSEEAEAASSPLPEVVV